MTERERRPEGRDDDHGLRVGFMTSTADAFETEHAVTEPVRPPKTPQQPDDDAEFERQMALGRASMRKHRNVLAVLAK